MFSLLLPSPPPCLPYLFYSAGRSTCQWSFGHSISRQHNSMSISFKTFGLYYLQSVLRPLILSLMKSNDLCAMKAVSAVLSGLPLQPRDIHGADMMEQRGNYSSSKPINSLSTNTHTSLHSFSQHAILVSNI